MALLKTPICEFGQEAIDFDLKSVSGEKVNLDEVAGENGTLIMFICNHCPYVQGIIDPLVEDIEVMQDAGIGVAAIMSNDADRYPADSFENMKEFAIEHDFSFPYLIDDTQDVAKAYDAVCTPDFYGFNSDLELQYRGRFSSSGMNHDAGAEHELLKAMLKIAETGEGPADQNPSMGCSIKWRERPE